jgi:hypothetical protein
VPVPSGDPRSAVDACRPQAQRHDGAGGRSPPGAVQRALVLDGGHAAEHATDDHERDAEDYELEPEPVVLQRIRKLG